MSMKELFEATRGTEPSVLVEGVESGKEMQRLLLQEMRERKREQKVGVMFHTSTARKAKLQKAARDANISVSELLDWLVGRFLS